MLDKFHGEVDRPYVLMHHIYCLKLGEPILHENKFAKKRAEEKKREKEEKLRASRRPSRRRPLRRGCGGAAGAAAVPEGDFRGGGLRRRGEDAECGE